ncbi:hypothetical protein [Pyrobaculum aerophilum]|uniref:PaREP13 n=1 Tax=Pyrobaculum aerophilum TaxID=13773 RepID=A0A371R5N3_9CREN|nr:hypothetical protein [Pyrobaculum aerophilum]RFA99388.1 hypothetical protein CGL52_03200 [Pyrobaculum aerophilum]
MQKKVMKELLPPTPPRAGRGGPYNGPKAGEPLRGATPPRGKPAPGRPLRGRSERGALSPGSPGGKGDIDIISPESGDCPAFLKLESPPKSVQVPQTPVGRP